MNKARVAKTKKDRPDRSDKRERPTDGRIRPHGGSFGRNRRDEHAENSDPSLIFGMLPVLEALRAGGRKIDKIAIAEGAADSRIRELAEAARSRGIVVNRLSRDAFSRIAPEGVNHQGVVAFAAAAEYVSVDEILDNADDDALLLVLDGVEDPRNLGAILRVAECAGAGGVLIPERRAVGLTGTVAKSSAGAIEHVKVAKAANLNRLIEELKKKGIWVVGTDADAETAYTDWDWRQPSALVLGGEGSGLHRLVSENCDVLVKIPMYGKIESLNVSVAAGVILFEAARQRGQ